MPSNDPLCSNKNNVIHKPEVHNISLRSQRKIDPRQLRAQKLADDCTCSSGDMLADMGSQKQKHTDTQTDIYAYHNPHSTEGAVGLIVMYRKFETAAVHCILKNDTTTFSEVALKATTYGLYSC